MALVKSMAYKPASNDSVSGMTNLEQPGADLGSLERAAIDNATREGTNWIIAPGVPSGVLETLAGKRLIELDGDHWLLTAMGYACSAHATVFYK